MKSKKIDNCLIVQCIQGGAKNKPCYYCNNCRLATVKIIFMKFQQKVAIITTKVKVDCLIQVNMNKVVITILQDSAVTQTGLSRLAIYSLVANFL